MLNWTFSMLNNYPPRGDDSNSKTNHQFDLEDLRTALNNRAADLSVYLIGNPNRKMSTGRDLRFGRHGSLSIVIAGPKIGGWFDHETGEFGGMFDLVMREQGCSFVEALHFAREYLGDAPLPARPKPAPLRLGDGDYDDRHARRNKHLACKLFDCAESINHPIARRYFERKRGLIVPPGLDGRVLRFLKQCPFGRDSSGAIIRHHCILALFTGISDNEPKAISRIALTSESKLIDRKMLGPTTGAAIKLSPDDDIGTTLYVGEGVETCIAGMLAGYMPAWALGSAGAIGNLPKLRGIGKLFIFGEVNDGNANSRAAQACADRWREQKSKAKIFVMNPQEGNDLNDAWLIANSGRAK
jgi:putative DNA primase/helicase